MEYKDLIGKSETDLQHMLREERGKLFELRVKSSVTPIPQHSQFRKLKVTIARILTALNSQKGQTK